MPCIAAPRIVVFFDENKDDLPGLSRTDRSLREAFRAQLGPDTEVHSESIGLSRAKEPGYEATAVEFYRAKDDRLVAGLTYAQLISIGFVVLGVIWLSVFSRVREGWPGIYEPRASDAPPISSPVV